MSVGTASGKVILFGEHAVVYGRPAIAVPVPDRQATVRVEAASSGTGILLQAEDLGCHYTLATAPPADALAHIVRLTLSALEMTSSQDLIVAVRSTIPIASGLGSSAAVSAATVRALAAHFGIALTPDEISELVYQTEILHHGTPSGIDNTVVAFEQPVYFVKGHAPVRFAVGRPLHLLIGDTGVSSSTKVVVADVRRRWEAELARYDLIFDAMGRIADRARQALELGDDRLVGQLMDRNQELLREIGVSSPELERLILAAKQAGALGAKLCGAGRGGNMVALATQSTAEGVASGLRRAGARDVIVACADHPSSVTIGQRAAF
jgi:mevalonate kinase